MNYPDRETMMALAYMVGAEGLNWHEDMDSLSVVRDGVPYRVEFEQYDELKRRGWVADNETAAWVTDAGRYWSDKWMRREELRIVEAFA